MTVRRVVIDANVWVSAAGCQGSVPDQIIALVRSGEIRSVLTQDLINQVIRRLARPPFNIPSDLVEDFEDEMRTMSDIVVPGFDLAVITAKSSDNRELEAAIAGGADAIITGDRRHLLPLGHYDGIPILTPAAFLAAFPPDTTSVP